MKKTFIALSILMCLCLPLISRAQVTDVDSSGINECAVISQNVRYGNRDIGNNSSVSVLQDFLNSNNYLQSAPTGFFGKATLSAVKAFQSANNISPTGYVGPFTRAKIQQIDCGNSISGATATTTSVILPVSVVSSSTTSPTDAYQKMKLEQAQALVKNLGITGASADSLVAALTGSATLTTVPVTTPVVGCVVSTVSGCTVAATPTTTHPVTSETLSSVLVLSKNPAFSNQNNVVPGTVHQKVASFVVQNTSVDNFHISGVQIGFSTNSPLSNLSLYVGGSQFVGTTISNLDSTNVIPVNIVIQGKQTLTFDFFADVNSGANQFTFNSSFLVHVNAGGQFSGALYMTLPVTGQMINVVSNSQTASSTSTSSPAAFSLSLNSNFPDQSLNSNTVHQKIGSFVLTNTSMSNIAKITSLQLGGTGVVGNVGVYQNSVQIGPTFPKKNNPVGVSVSDVVTIPANISLPPGTSTTFDVYADIGDMMGAIRTNFRVIGVDSISQIPLDTMFVLGQAIAVSPVASVCDSTTGVSVLKNPVYGDQSVNSGAQHVKIGSFVIANKSCEDINIDQTKLGMMTSVLDSKINNLSLYTDGAFKGSTSYFNSYQNHKDGWNIATTITKGQSVTIDMYADFPVDANGTYQMMFLPTYVGKISNSTITPSADILGQIITVTPQVVVSDAKECDIDVASNTNTCAGISAIKVMAQDRQQSMVALNLDPSVAGDSTKVKFDITFGPDTPNGWNVDIGDSIENDGWGGGEGSFSNTAEMQITSSFSNASSALSVYGNDDVLSHPENTLDQHLLLKNVNFPNGSLASKTISFTISDKDLMYDLSATGASSSDFQSPYLYALNGETDSDTRKSSDKIFYAGFNRVIKDTYLYRAHNSGSYRFGTGVTKVHISLQ